MEEDIQNYNQSINKHGQPQKYASFDLQGTMNARKRTKQTSYNRL